MAPRLSIAGRSTSGLGQYVKQVVIRYVALLTALYPVKVRDSSLEEYESSRSEILQQERMFDLASNGPRGPKGASRPRPNLWNAADKGCTGVKLLFFEICKHDKEKMKREKA